MNENTNNISLFPSAGTAVGQVRTLEVIGAEIRTFTASMVNNIIEIGRRMCEAKEMLPYGQFGDWIKANTGYSRSTANNFMRIYQEYGSRQGCLFGAEMENDQAFGQLTYTKALALLEVPSEEREQFVEDHDVVNMSTRELQQAIAERDAAKKELDDLKQEMYETSELLEKKTDDYAALSTVAREYKENAEAAEARVKELEARPAETITDQGAIDAAVAEAVKKADAAHAAELEKIKAGEEEKRKALEKKAADAEARATKAAEKLKKAESNARVLTDADGAEAEAKAAAAEAEKARAEAAELRRQLAMSGEATVTFKLYFAAWQKDYANMMDALAKADEDTAGRLKAAINAQIAGWQNA